MKHAFGGTTADLRYVGKDATRRMVRITGDVLLTVDVDELIKHLGRKALASKRHTSRAYKGAIVAKVKNIKQEPA